MSMPYKIETHDDLLPESTRVKVWEYIKTLDFYSGWMPTLGSKFKYNLNQPQEKWMILQHDSPSYRIHRVPLSSDEAGLKENFPIIYLLWKELNRKLDNQYLLTGNPEGIYGPDFKAPQPSDPNLSAGWRAYINAFHQAELMKGTGYIHRDTALEYNDPDTVTMLYVANLEWYPSWSGEVKYFPDDPNSLDHQQFNHGYQQQRNYGIGWLDQGQVVSPVPGRLIIQDGRCLHSTNPTNSPKDTPSVKVVFRARRITS